MILTLMLCSILIVSAYAIFYLWSASATVTISTSSPYIKVYQDGSEVTSINLGTLVPGTRLTIRFLIKNTHPNATIYVRWGSTLGDITDKITDAWWHGELALPPIHGGFIQTYQVLIASDCPLGTYSWTLYLHGTV